MLDKRRVVADIEADSLTPTVIWVICCRDIDTGEVFVFKRPDLYPKEFQNFTRTVSLWVYHNGIDFDIPAIELLVPDVRGVHRPDNTVDTLICSRLFNYNLLGGHGLDAWGRRFNSPKIEFNDYSKLTQEMVDYCIQDTEVTYRLFKRIEPFLDKPEWKPALDLEHRMQWVCREMHENGFWFDIDKAKELRKEIGTKVEELKELLQKEFPPQPKVIKEITPKPTKFGTINKQDFRWVDNGDLSQFELDSPFTRIEWEEFNPGSTTQIVSRLNAAGWKPTEKTKGHIELERKRRKSKEDKERLEYFKEWGWKVNEQNLATLPDTAPRGAKQLSRYLILSGRLSTIDEWIGCYCPSTHRIHGKFVGLGAWTHRMAHKEPNTANIVRVSFGEDQAPKLGEDGGYGVEFRSCWGADPSKWLVGVDAEGIQLRILAHYMNDPEFTKAIEEGRKEDGSDIHTLNWNALGRNICRSRDDAKTFIYSWLLGAGTRKTAEVLGCSMEEATLARTNFLEAYPGLKKLKEEQILRDAERGYFIGLDGRPVKVANEHLVLTGYLQNGEAIIMKKWCLHWRDRLIGDKINFRLVDFVHDENQTEVDTYEEAEYTKRVQVDSFPVIGEQLGLRCKLTGSGTIGKNWYETH